MQACVVERVCGSVCVCLLMHIYLCLCVYTRVRACVCIILPISLTAAWFPPQVSEASTYVQEPVRTGKVGGLNCHAPQPAAARIRGFIRPDGGRQEARKKWCPRSRVPVSHAACKSWCQRAVVRVLGGGAGEIWRRAAPAARESARVPRGGRSNQLIRRRLIGIRDSLGNYGEEYVTSSEGETRPFLYQTPDKKYPRPPLVPVDFHRRAQIHGH